MKRGRRHDRQARTEVYSLAWTIGAWLHSPPNEDRNFEWGDDERPAVMVWDGMLTEE
jgi:hypothetical protein